MTKYCIAHYSGFDDYSKLKDISSRNEDRLKEAKAYRIQLHIQDLARMFETFRERIRSGEYGKNSTILAYISRFDASPTLRSYRCPRKQLRP